MYFVYQIIIQLQFDLSKYDVRTFICLFEEHRYSVDVLQNTSHLKYLQTKFQKEISLT